VNEVAAVFFDGVSSRPQQVNLSEAGAASLRIRAVSWERIEPRATIFVTTRIAGIHRTLQLADGAQLQVQDNAVVDLWFPHRQRFEALVGKLENHALVVAASLLTTILTISGVLFYGLPAAAERVASWIPDAVARSMGEQTIELLDKFGFRESQLPPSRRDALQEKFVDYTADLPNAGHYRLRFVRADDVGANAFALPGGIIVVTDQMVELIDNDEQFLAVIAHELGHDAHRHVLRSVLQASGVVLMAAFFTGDVSSASTLVVAIPTFLLENHYSRTFENDADDYAFASLAAHGISPRRFAEVMLHLQKSEAEAEGRVAYLSTHPPTSQRIFKAQAAATEFEAGHSPPGDR